MRTSVVSLGLLMMVAALAGCTGDDGGDGTPTTTDTGTTTSTQGNGTTTDTGTAGAVTAASLEASTGSGAAPLNVTFALDADGTLEGAEWRIGYGDGEEAVGDGSDLPTSVNHTYRIGGNFTVSFTVTGSDGETAEADTLEIQVTAPADGDPPQLVWEYGQVLGCSADIHGQTDGLVPPNCVSYAAGPTGPPVDAVWIPLDARYWGLAYTSTIVQADGADSDCSFFADDHETYLGSGSNAGGPCLGDAVPEGAAWLMLWPYALPSESMVLTFIDS